MTYPQDFDTYRQLEPLTATKKAAKKMAKKALVIDDSKVAYYMLRKMLLERRIEAAWAGSGEDGMIYLEQQTPDLIFLDIMLPGKDGFAIAQAIRERTANAPPIIICSSSAAESSQPHGFNAAQAFLIKPYSSQDLDNALRRVYGKTVRISDMALTPESYRAVSEDISRVNDGATVNDRKEPASAVAKHSASSHRKLDRRAPDDNVPAKPEIVVSSSEPATEAPADKRLDSISELLGAMHDQLNAVNLVLAEQRRTPVAEVPSVTADASVRQQIAVQVEQVLSKRLADEQFHELLQMMVTRGIAVQIDRIVREAADSAAHQVLAKWQAERQAAADAACPLPPLPSPPPLAPRVSPRGGVLRRLWRNYLKRR